MATTHSQDEAASFDDVEKASSQLSDPKPEPDAPPTDFIVSFTGDDDPRSPKSMSTARKWLITIIVSTTSFLFVVGLGISPMLLAPLSEFYGRKPVYVGSLFFFVVFIIPSAVAQNLATIIVTRFLDGFAGAAFLSVAGGTVSDLFPKAKLAFPMMIYTLGPFLGPQLGPLVADFINYNTSWRWTFWVALIWAFAQWAAIIIFVPETYMPVLLRREARKIRKESGDDRWYAPIEKMDRSIAQTILRSCYRPFLLLTLEPMCLCLCLYCSVLLGVLYLFFGAFGLVFRENHGFKLWQVGLTFLGITVGMILGSASNPFWNKNYMRLLKKHEEEHGEKGGSEPEYRLPPAIGGSPLVVIGLLWFGWTTYSSVHWIVPIVGSAFFGAGVIMIFSGVFTFLVDAYPLYGASALAANSFARSMFAAAFPLFGPAMYNNLGFQWATFLLAMLTLVMAPFPYIFYRYGKEIRKRSKYAGSR
ncbi:MFS general substrate transporter [Mytilinidion resinicola]|uniref:MFS general substrate transporter n=1 Tax=Mytilinidion resinicola TaxID=574789 RepID=A0A6A6Z2I1_9PEZI|nr:MFS general substrate transporter [Mytilinidion resinicola]KAF2814504.1 MFS general substrate transporter [Mytilinidion resinicola]